MVIDISCCRSSIVNLRHRVCGRDLPESGRRRWSYLLTLAGFDIRWWCIVYRHRSKKIRLTEIQCSKFGVANARRIFQHCIEDRLKFAR